jgi:hypothetical protein
LTVSSAKARAAIVKISPMPTIEPISVTPCKIGDKNIIEITPIKAIDAPKSPKLTLSDSNQTDSNRVKGGSNLPNNTTVLTLVTASA